MNFDDLMSDKQAHSVANANRRSNIWWGSIRSSKTVAQIFRWFTYVADEAPLTGHLVMVGKTMTSLKRNILEPTKDFFGSLFNYSTAKQEAYFCGRTLQLIGANDDRAEGKIRGMTVAGGLGDELTLSPQDFYKQMLGRMSVTGAKFFGTTNPDHPKHWLKKLYIDREHELDMRTFYFKLEDNKYLSQEYIDNLKKEYVGLWYRRFILGLWVAADGAVYDFFQEAEHFIAVNEKPKALWYDIACDYGTNNPTVFLLFGNNPHTTPCVWLEKTYYYSGRDSMVKKTDDDYVKDYEKFTQGYDIRYITLDPSAASLKAALRKKGHRVRNANNDVANGIQTQSRMLKSGRYKIINCPENEPVKDEYYAYSWDEKASLRKGADVVKKEEDHTKDAERYKLETDYGKNKIDYSLFNRM